MTNIPDPVPSDKQWQEVEWNETLEFCLARGVWHDTPVGDITMRMSIGMNLYVDTPNGKHYKLPREAALASLWPKLKQEAEEHGED